METSPTHYFTRTNMSKQHFDSLVIKTAIKPTFSMCHFLHLHLCEPSGSVCEECVFASYSSPAQQPVLIYLNVTYTSKANYSSIISLPQQVKHTQSIDTYVYLYNVNTNLWCCAKTSIVHSEF